MESLFLLSDINTDAVTFLGNSVSYLHFKQPIESDLLDSNIIFNFRTFLRNTVLLYIHDHLNNFVEVELLNGQSVTAKFNRFNIILEQTRHMPGKGSYMRKKYYSMTLLKIFYNLKCPFLCWKISQSVYVTKV